MRILMPEQFLSARPFPVHVRNNLFSVIISVCRLLVHAFAEWLMEMFWLEFLYSLRLGGRSNPMFKLAF